MTAPPTARRRCDRSYKLREHTPLVRKIAGRIGAKAPANVGMDELIQAGMIGLNEAMSRFESNQGASFDT
jgi:RNA polymerase sigma factor for flagellar operon FliA